MENKNSSKLVVLTFSVLVLCFLAGFYIFAWTGPTAAPPSNNTSAPINTGSETQTKQGNLTIGTAIIKGDGSISTNLNSDKVDDLHAADLLAQAGGKGLIYTVKCSWIISTDRATSLGSCTPDSCAAGWTSLGVGCSATGISCGVGSWTNQYSSFCFTPSGPGGWPQVAGVSGYCERYCYKE